LSDPRAVAAGKKVVDPVRQQGKIYWSSFAATIAFAVMLMLWWIHSPGQDHLGSIPLDDDGTWYQNYEPGFELQDHEIFFDGIGHSIEDAQQADIIFLGSSTVLFGIDWRLSEEFERTHHVKLFNMAFAGVTSGEFSLRLIQKWGLHPKLWIINADLLDGKIDNSFFYMFLPGGGNFKNGSPSVVVNTSWIRAFLTVVGRNIRWRWEVALGTLNQISFRSAQNGNWYTDKWPARIGEHPNIDPPVDSSCPENPKEADLARRYLDTIGGTAILIQVPSVIACAQRMDHLASALGVADFTVAPEQFSTIDGGWHLDDRGSRLYTAKLFTWLEQQPAFRRLFP
jgi:hypothetical protein